MTVPSFRATIRRVRKLAAVGRVSEYRRGLVYGVAASAEHHATPFQHEFRTVLDVGANRGQFALFATHRFPGTTVHSFEPGPAARARLQRVFRNRPEIRIYEVALAARNGSSRLNVARDDDISSLLQPTESQVEAFPASEIAGSVVVRTARLDDELADVRLAAPILLKIDVQGTELEVLRGATARLPEVETVLVECSFIELFAGQALADDVVGHLRSRGFRLASICTPTRDKAGRCLQADLLFERATAGQLEVAGSFPS